jgi:GDP-L-fucose synthase
MKFDSKIKICVVGGTGLVGSAIIKKLKEKGYTNIVSTFHNRQPTIQDIRWEQLDLLKERDVLDFFVREKFDIVFLAAAKVGGILANNTYRADFIFENLAIQNNVIYSSYNTRVRKLLFLGSTCIYPKNCPQPIKEEYLLTSELEYTNEPYAIAKIAGIKMCESFNIQYGTNFISLMPTNLFGFNDNFDLEKSHVLPALIRKIHLGKCLENNDWESIREDLEKYPIENINHISSINEILTILNKYGIKIDDKRQTKVEIWGSGKPMREFLWSDDMADACVYLMEKIDFKDIISNNTSNEIRNTHINIGTGEDISIKELAEKIKNIVGFKGDLFFDISKPDGTLKKLTDVSKLNSLGWKHKTSLDEGIRKLYNWYLQ